MNTIGIIAAVLVLAVAAILIYAAFKPDQLAVQRSTSVKARPETIFPFIDDFDRWSAWSPYEKMDPAMKRTRSGAPRGKGAVYAWDGDKNVGKGRMEIANTSPSKITIRLDFDKPFAGSNVVEFRLEPKGDAANVTWAMQGRCAYVAKVLGIFVNMDNMIGRDFEAGLASLKAVAER